ncbi:MAG: CobW family GTP-binding protein [Actinomycetales bacterium]
MVPVIALTGYLGSGKTTLLNHLLSRPGARIGVVVNDFGTINVDAGLVVGQVDKAASIAGGCLCCLSDAGGLDRALARLARPRLRLDAVVVEASGLADPLVLTRLIRFSGAEHARPGGLIDVVDATEYQRGVAAGMVSPARFAAATLVVVNKIDRVPAASRERVLGEVTAAVRERHPSAPVIPAVRGQIDPALVYDVLHHDDPPDQLPLAALMRAERASHGGEHHHATAVSVVASEPTEADGVLDLLESPPTGVYRIKGCVPVRTGRAQGRRYVVNLVGRHVHIATAPPSRSEQPDGLVAIGLDTHEATVRSRLQAALRPASGPVRTAGLRRLQRYRRLSL